MGSLKIIILCKQNEAITHCRSKFNSTYELIAIAPIDKFTPLLILAQPMGVSYYYDSAVSLVQSPDNLSEGKF
jgi:hypothetical protein